MWNDVETTQDLLNFKVVADTAAHMNGEQYATLLIEHGIGVRRMSHDLFELEELPIEKGDV